MRLPKLYIYDHCPFCARARLILGLKRVEHELVFLASHDEATPIGLIGSKQAPILQLEDGKAFPESLDIVRYVDEKFGGPPILKEASGREDLKAWAAKLSPHMSALAFPRDVRTPFAEFAVRASREYFQAKKEKQLNATFDELIAKTPEHVAAVNALLEDLAPMLHSETEVNAGGVGYDDITTFPMLRRLTLVKDVKWPTKVRAYMDHMSDVGDVPLHDTMATI